MKKPIVVYFPEGFADWEGAFLLPELREAKMPVVIVSDKGSPVTSIGGMRVHVDRGLDKISAENSQALILIGSDSWPNPEENINALNMALKFHKHKLLVAGICGATVAMARIGLLDQVKHTSNDLNFLKKINPNYKNENNYLDQLAVTDGNIITAAGVGPLEFTLEVMKYLNIYTEVKRQQWYALYKNGVKPPMEFWTS